MKENIEPSIGDKAAAGSARKKAILVVDDEPNIRRVIKCCFQCEGDNYQIDTAASGNSAKTKIQQGYYPDAILSDIEMPDGTGEDLLKWLQANRPELAERMILMTAGDIINNPQGFIQVMKHKKRLLEKPFSFEAVRRSIDKVLASK